MVEVKADKSFHYSRMICGTECNLFNTLKEALCIHKPIRENNGLKYTWDNLRLNGT